jgi:hypothetical protein
LAKEVEYATASELIKIFRGLSIGSLANLRSARRGPRYCKFGKKVLYRISDVRRYLEDNEIKTIDQHE